jgi:hypothetical protein
MTINHLKKLDNILIRLSRVNKQVEFKNTIKKEIKEMFKRIYIKDLLYISFNIKGKDFLNLSLFFTLNINFRLL